MRTALKLLALPTLFILPWLFVKLTNLDALAVQSFTSQPVWVGLALLPGALLALFWVVNQFRK